MSTGKHENGSAASTREVNERTVRNRAYVEHVALRVCDIHWHIRFFREVLGMDMREVDGSPDNPRQYWTLGGLQFIRRLPGRAGWRIWASW